MTLDLLSIYPTDWVYRKLPAVRKYVPHPLAYYRARMLIGAVCNCLPQAALQTAQFMLGNQPGGEYLSEFASILSILLSLGVFLITVLSRQIFTWTTLAGDERMSVTAVSATCTAACSSSTRTQLKKHTSLRFWLYHQHG